MKAVDISTEIIISCPIAEVAHYASDPDHVTDWYINIKSVEWKTSKPLQLGSRVAFKAQFLGKQLAYTYEMVEWSPNQKLVMRTADGPFPMETTYCWESISENETRMTLRNRGVPSGFSRLVAPFMKMAMKKANQKDLNLFKMVLEGKHQTS